MSLPSFSVKDWLAIAGVLVALGAGFNEIHSLREADAKQEKVDARQDADVQRIRVEIREEIKEVNRKLDRLIERRQF